MIDYGDVQSAITAAANMQFGDNPTYTADDFLATYPQFGVFKPFSATEKVIPDVVLTMWITVAQASLSADRYGDMWQPAMGFYISHWLTLYLQALSDPRDPVNKVVQKGLAKGVLSSKSVGGLSAGYDFNIFANEFDGWGTYKLTIYGQQFITVARLVSRGGFAVW